MAPSETPYVIRVNNQVVWKSEQDANTIVEVEGMTPRGALFTARVPPGEMVMDLVVRTRDNLESRFLDLEEDRLRREREEETLSRLEDAGETPPLGRGLATNAMDGGETVNRQIEDAGPSAREERINPDVNFDKPEQTNSITGLRIEEGDLPGEPNPMRKQPDAPAEEPTSASSDEPSEPEGGDGSSREDITL